MQLQPQQKRSQSINFHEISKERFVLKHIAPFLHIKEEATSLVNPVTSSVDLDHHIVEILLILYPIENIDTKIKASSLTRLLQILKSL